MPMCQAYGCCNKRGDGSKKSLFSIPDPTKDRVRCAEWLRNIGIDKFNVKTYVFSRERVVCEDHFEPSCFEEDVRARIMGYVPPKKTLKADAVPTIFVHRTPPAIEERARNKRLREEKEEEDRRKLLKNLLGEAQGTTEESEMEPIQETCQPAHIMDDSHDGDESDVPGHPSTFSPFSDVAYKNVPSPAAYVNVETGPEVIVQPSTTEGITRKKKRRRRQSGFVGSVDTSTQTIELPYPSPTTEPPCIELTHAEVQTENDKEYTDQSTQSPEPEEESSTPSDHNYAVPTVDHPSMLETQEEARRKKVRTPTNPVIVVNPAPRLDTSTSQLYTADHSEHLNFRESMQTNPSSSVTGPSTSDASSSTSVGFHFPDRSVSKFSGIAPQMPCFSSLTGPSTYSASTSGELHIMESSSKFRESMQTNPSSSVTGPSTSDASSSTSVGFHLPDRSPSKKKVWPQNTNQPEEPSSPRSSSFPQTSPVKTPNRMSDGSYVPSDVATESDEENERWLTYCVDSKYIVFGNQLEQLLYSLPCKKCFGGHISELKKRVRGTLLTVTVHCVCGNLVTRWNSQPMTQHSSVGNLLFAASALFSGQTHEVTDFFCSVFNLESIKKSLFYEIQDEWLFSAVNSAYNESIAEARREAQGSTLTLCGDGRCDSPGYNAKYCSYTMMNMHTNKILSMALVQVSETTSSVAMEKVGFQRTLNELLEAGVDISTVATDRHVSIRKLMREEYPGIEHQFDVWHVCKSIRKKLVAKSKKKECSDLGPWIKCITNHLWWAASNCNENEDLLIEMWQSITHHICNIHSWNSGEHFHECRHAPIPQEEARKTKWLTPGSPPHEALQDLLFDRNLVKDIRQLTKACRTGDLEAFHSMLLKYCPKRKHFPYRGMLARLQLAVLDHNHNQGRDCKVVKKGPRKGEEQCSFEYSKRSSAWVVKVTKEKKNYMYLVKILEDVLKMQSGLRDVQPVQIPDLPRNVARVPCPPKDELLARRYSRFK